MADLELPNPEATVEQPPVEPPKPSLEDVQKELTKFQETSKLHEDNWKKQQQVTSQKDREIQRLREQLMSNESQANINKALIALYSQQKGQPLEEVEAEVKQNQPNLMKEYENIVKQAEAQKKVSELTTRIKDIQERTEALGISPQDDEYEVIRAFAEAGKFDKAEARLNKVEQSKQTKPPVKTEPDEERINRLAAEKLRAELEKRGLLTQETGGPTASARTRAEKIAAYARGEISSEEFKKIM